MKKIDLKEWMKKHRFTPSNLARDLGIKASATVWEWTNRGRSPIPKTMEKLNNVVKRVEKEPFPAEDFFDNPIIRKIRKIK